MTASQQLAVCQMCAELPAQRADALQTAQFAIDVVAAAAALIYARTQSETAIREYYMRVKAVMSRCCPAAAAQQQVQTDICSMLELCGASCDYVTVETAPCIYMAGLFACHILLRELCQPRIEHR